MRTFHTNINVCGVSLEGHVGAIGRLHPSGESVHSTVPILQAREKKSLSVFDPISKHDAMIRSLNDGISYFRNQSTGLSRSEVILREMLHCSSGKTMVSVPDINDARRRFFLEALNSITSEKFKSFPLFGYGHESPMRLHLTINSKRSTHQLSPVPLLAKPAFRSVHLSLGVNESVRSNICEESIGEILNLMLSTRRKEESLKSLFKQVENQKNSTVLGFDHNPKRAPSFFQNLKFRIYKSFKHRIPKSFPEVPV